jgi:hypothetical protein
MRSVLAAVAGAGLLISLIGHVAVIAGHDFIGSAWPVMFVGIFVVWIPTVLTMGNLRFAARRKDAIKIALIGAPDWVKYTVYVVFGYAIVNFVARVVLNFGHPDSVKDDFWTVGSSHAMAFYAAAWGFATAAINRRKLGIEWKCEKGHEVTPGANYCEQCGAPAVHSGRG